MYQIILLASAGVFAIVSAIKNSIQKSEIERTKRAKIRQKKRQETIKRVEKLNRDRIRLKHLADRKSAEYDLRSLLLDSLTSIQKDCSKEIEGMDKWIAQYNEAHKIISKKWQSERDKNLRHEFREIEVNICKFYYRRVKLIELIKKCSLLKHKLTSRSLYFKDANRYESLIPNINKETEPPNNLPKKYDVIEASIVKLKTKRYLKLPCSIKVEFPTEPSEVKFLSRKKKIHVFINAVNYSDKKGVYISIIKANILKTFKEKSLQFYSAKILDQIKCGYKVLVQDSIRAFLPFSLSGKMILEKDSEIQVNFHELDRFFDSPVVSMNLSEI